MSQLTVQKTLGPVADLEKHLPAEWWKTLFNSLYLKTDGDVVECPENTQYEVDLLLGATHLDKNAKILDLCCGQGRHSLELFRRGYKNLFGLDRSRYLIRIAKKRAQQLQASIRFSEGDARKIRLPESSLDCVVLFGNSFGYFETQEDDHAVLRSIQRILKSGGQLVMDIVDGHWMQSHYTPRSWEWIDENQFVCRERSLTGDKQRIISREVVVHAERGVIADQFYAERLYDLEGITKLLMGLGFTDVVKHSTVSPKSSREQDLGMMENRMLISAIGPKKKAPISPSPQQTKKIEVLLGDPRLHDTVKREGQFNPEDFETINRLKSALSTLNYTIKFWDYHEDLFKHLSRQKPEFVLNFCDEGLNNDALKELHVPALIFVLIMLVKLN